MLKQNKNGFLIFIILLLIPILMMTYDDLINIPSFGKKKENFVEERGPIVFYCKDCKEIVETECINEFKNIYKCAKCKGRNIAFGTQESIKEFYFTKGFRED
ncbi:MAG: hypothetical protein PHO80_02450 [Candidatus Gracilibacteria bacterium]|nr:hypothetical protein [Candidatus Gracilibacteria bacterium]MDD4530386.1 hypothetical protein [Candidatus Gracilibacteria bacterium]